MRHRRRLTGFVTTLMLAMWPPASPVRAQAKGQSASDLVEFLTHDSSQADPAFTCGSLGADIERYRSAARSLAAMGATALPAIEEALDSISRDGMESKFAFGTGWLSLAYAKIKGPAAFPRLRRMIDDLQIEPFHPMLDSAIAISLGLTSYVGGSLAPSPLGACQRYEPRASLDHLVFALDRNDQRMFEEDLGPNARAALDAILKGSGWLPLRLWLGHGSSAWGGAAVGYRFEIPGRWSEPDEALAPPPESGVQSPSHDPLNPEIKTVFLNRYGAECGRVVVKFLTPPWTTPPPAPFLIDNADVLDLLRVVAPCAMNTTRGGSAAPKD